MRGSIVKKGPSYYVVFDAPPGDDGRRRRKWHKAGASRREADLLLNRLVGQVQTGEYVERTSTTVGSFLQDEWLPAIRATVKPSTFEFYETMVRAYLVPRIGRHRLQALTPAVLNGLYGDLLVGGGRHGQPLSARAVRSVHKVLRRALRDAERWELVHRNVADRADPPDPAAPAIEAWDAETLARFLADTADDRLGPLWQVMATTGMRRGEALALRWSDLDLSARRITIRRNLTWVRNAPVFVDPKTAKSRRLVPIPAETAEALRFHRKRQVVEQEAAGEAYATNGLVFADEAGDPLKPPRVTRTFGSAVKRLGLPTITLHGLRHTWATLALGAGIPAKVASEVLGHASVAITLDTYSHVTPGMADDATERVAELLRKVR